MRGIISLKHIVMKNNVAMASRNIVVGLIKLYDGNPQMSRFKHSNPPDEPKLDRDFLAKLWVVDKEMAKELEKRRGVIDRHKDDRDEKSHLLEQPPVSQSITGYLAPSSPEEVVCSSLFCV